MTKEKSRRYQARIKNTEVFEYQGSAFAFLVILLFWPFSRAFWGQFLLFLGLLSKSRMTFTIMIVISTHRLNVSRRLCEFADLDDLFAFLAFGWQFS